MNKAFFFLFGTFLFLVSVFSYLFVESNVFSFFFASFAFNNRLIVSILFIIVISIFFLFYLFLISKIKEKSITIFDVWKIIFLTCIFLLFSYPAMLSYDIFNYIVTAKVIYLYQENPYIIMPIEFIREPLLEFMHAANKISLYGPSWIFLSFIPHFTGFQNFTFTLLTFKIFNLLFYLGTTVLIWKLTKKIVSVALFSLNPLVIIETLISSHNDIVMIFFMLCSFFYIQQNKKILALLFLFVSILVKYATIFLAPIFIYLLWKKNQDINWQKIYKYSLILMSLPFFLSPFREEIYPWYAIWFLVFTSLVNKKIINQLTTVFSFSLLLRYIPFIYWGTHAGITPFLKIGVTFFPLSLYSIYYWIKRRYA
ncbi:MAG: hypothetical protein A3J14_01990 [Candidatus Levybacteria bacterium RIFCSPLOWO2_02_FULL_37_18]|nr:MAG: hypothetical protein A3J14_01990 [Candidatus Levybacteria bacterium RIFCSPLOWO2_02_FULL_37_18]